MGLVTNVTSGPVQIPHEAGEWIDFRKISYLTLDKAKKVRLQDIAAEMVGMKDAMSALTADLSDGVRAAAQTARAENPLVSFDKRTILQHGIVAWSYKAVVGPDTIDDLDEVTAEWAARQIVELALPGEATTKKDSSPSTAT